MWFIPPSFCDSSQVVVFQLGSGCQFFLFVIHTMCVCVEAFRLGLKLSNLFGGLGWGVPRYSERCAFPLCCSWACSWMLTCMMRWLLPMPLSLTGKIEETIWSSVPFTCDPRTLKSCLILLRLCCTIWLVPMWKRSRRLCVPSTNFGNLCSIPDLSSWQVADFPWLCNRLADECLSASQLGVTTSTCHLLLQLLAGIAGAVSLCESCSLISSAAKASYLLLVGIFAEMIVMVSYNSWQQVDTSFSRVLSVSCWCFFVC